jgi:recombination protein RecA
MSQAMRKLSGIINKTNTIEIFINQIREKVGVMFGNPETTSGGRALKFYASVRLEVRRSEQIKAGNDVVGNKVTIKVVKNKVAPPFKQAIVDIVYGKGVSKMGELVDLAVELEIIKKSGAWYAYEGEKIGQGRENAKDYLETHADMAKDIEAKVRQAYQLK